MTKALTESTVKFPEIFPEIFPVKFSKVAPLKSMVEFLKSMVVAAMLTSPPTETVIASSMNIFGVCMKHWSSTITFPEHQIEVTYLSPNLPIILLFYIFLSII